jgi:hypothetical protein
MSLICGLEWGVELLLVSPGITRIMTWGWWRLFSDAALACAASRVSGHRPKPWHGSANDAAPSETRVSGRQKRAQSVGGKKRTVERTTGMFITCRGLDQGTYMYPKKKDGKNKVIHTCHL